VSHDLRAPLRAIDGFSQILEEDHLERLDEDGKRVVGVIRKNTQKMGQLIDDLLAFARLSRKHMQAQAVDMSPLVQQAIEEVSSLEPTRALDFRVGNLPDTVGDAALLKQVWLNLISNAVKYSRPRDRAIVEVAAQVADGDVTYSVKDNGVGFDMKYQAKLFGVFQRLHAANEFEGTGVGLALVQRIIQRHHGRIWAESRPGEGATFSFTLPRKDKDRGA
jgi:light-regulated signal transduction histidine kinase (bacteriophytochrome)